MAHFFNYYYIGESNLADENLEREKPVLLSLSKVQNGKKGETDRHMHTHMEIFYFESGTGFFEFRNKIFPIKANDLLVVDSKQVHMQYSDSNSQPLTYYCFAIDNLHLKGRNLNCITTQGYLLHGFGNENNRIYENIRNMLAELQERQYCFFNKIQVLFIEILVDIIRLERQLAPQSSEKQQQNGDNYLDNIKEYILAHYAEDLTLDELSKMCFMNKSYFLHQFKKQFNISPMRYVNLVRIEQAKQLLSETNLSVTEISSEVGIGNPVYFTEFFTKTIGISPTKYRRIVHGNLQ